jgi:hypothetical protein
VFADQVIDILSSRAKTRDHWRAMCFIIRQLKKFFMHMFAKAIAIWAVAIAAGGAWLYASSSEPKSAAALTQAQPLPRIEANAAEAAAEIGRVGLEQYFHNVSVRACTTIASMGRADVRAAYFRECVPDMIKKCRTMYARRDYC